MDEKQQPVSGLAGLPPGPELGALLATFDLAEVANADTVEVLQGWSRQLAHTQAKFMAALVEVTRSTPYSSLPPGEQPSVAESAQRQLAAGTWATAEIAAALTWTTRGAEKEVYFAADLLEKLPLVYAALSAGHIDRGKAWVFVDVLTTADLTALQIEKICKAVVPKAGSWTTGQLRSRLMRMILAVDPDYAARRYRAAVRDRGVIGYLGPDGTAVIQGFGLSPAEAAAASERLDRLADQIVRAGHPGLLPQVRADMFTGLLDGRFEGLRSEEIIAAMMADTAAVTDTNTDADTAAAAPDTPSTDRSDTGGPSATVSSPDLPTEAAPDEASPDPRALGAGASGVGTAAGRDKVADRWGGEIRVGLSTLLLRDDRPGEIPGWGPVLADIARLMTARQHGSEWRFAVTDPDGYLILAGITRRRPTTGSPGRASNAAPVARGCRGGVVELHVPATLLAELAGDAEACGEWAGVIADIARQYAHRGRLTTALATRPHDRLAHIALRRHVQIRDRRCVAPGCRRPARRCELDHTTDYARGGLTLACNSGPLCLRHHVMKTEGGWRLEQPEPGLFHWTSPLGRSYWTRGEPIDPPDPDPCPRPVEPDEPDAPSTRWMNGPTMQRPPPPPTPEPPPPAPTAPPEDDEPPF